MKKLKVMTLFIITISIGLFIMNEFMVGLPGEACNCIDSAAAEQECEAACYLHGGCEDFRQSGQGYCYWPEICVTLMYNICKEEAPNGVPIVVKGYHYYDGCDSCDGL